MNYPLFIARKIYNGGDKTRKVSKPAITIATIGVAIGLAVMIVSVCVVLGFKHTIRDKMVGFGSHITVANFLTLQGSEQYPIAVNDSLIKELKAVPGIKHVQRYAYTQGILKTDNDFLGVMLKGVGPDFDSTFIHNNMVEGSLPHFSATENQQKLVISKTIADKLNLKVGQRLFAYFINDQGVRTRKFTIAGIYETNMKQFDSQICFTDLYTANKLNGWEADQYSGVELLVNDFSQLNNITLRVLNKVKNTTDHYGEIRHIFLWFATFIIGRGLLIGNLIGFGIIFLQKWTGLIKLDPQTYYVSTVPVEVNLPLIIALNLATLLACVAVLIAPSYLISRIHPAKSMHYE